MTFVSYAQNYEDVMLWRALKHVEKGFYVDVGAWDPVQDSVTKAFYERGWRGINIEPAQRYYELLRRDRPDDINIRVAVGQVDGELTLYEIPESGLSTTDREIAEMHRAAGFEVVERRVAAVRLNTVLQQHVSGPIHFLKIDVEGAEGDALSGLDLSIWRPWILVIEATIPNSPEANYAFWEPMVLSAGYVMAYFDGLNRFYVAQEHSKLAQALAIPPNVFDRYVTANLLNAQGDLESLRAEHGYAEERISGLNHEIGERDTKIAKIEQELAGRDEKIASISNGVVERDGQIANLEQALIERGGQIARLNRVAAERDEKIVHLAREVAQLQDAIRLIRTSISWRATAPARAVLALMQRLWRQSSRTQKASGAESCPGDGNSAFLRTDVPKKTILGNYEMPIRRLGTRKRRAIAKTLRSIKEQIRKEG